MCSYNQINNSYGCQNSKMLNNILKEELGFQGFVMSECHTAVSCFYFPFSQQALAYIASVLKASARCYTTVSVRE